MANSPPNTQPTSGGLQLEQRLNRDSGTYCGHNASLSRRYTDEYDNAVADRGPNRDSHSDVDTHGHVHAPTAAYGDPSAAATTSTCSCHRRAPCCATTPKPAAQYDNAR